MRVWPDTFSGRKHTKETKRKISEAQMGEKNSMFGKPSPMLGRKHTKEAIKKMSDAKIGKYVGENHPMYGKHHSEETKKKMSDAVSGKNHNNWRGGIGNLPYAFDFNEELKELIKKRDGYTCQFPSCDIDIDLTVHHIDYDKMNSDPKNLITLCREHNSKVNFNRENWEIYFMGEMI